MLLLVEIPPHSSSRGLSPESQRVGADTRGRSTARTKDAQSLSLASSSSPTSVSPLSEADLIVDTIAHLSMNYYEQGPELPLNGLAEASPSYVEQEKRPEQPGK